MASLPPSPAEPPKGLKNILEGLCSFARRSPATMVEIEGFTLAFHYRAAPEPEEAVRRVVAERRAATGPSFQVQEGKKVMEIKPAGTKKGDAVEAFMAEPPSPGTGRREAYLHHIGPRPDSRPPNQPTKRQKTIRRADPAPESYATPVRATVRLIA